MSNWYDPFRQPAHVPVVPRHDDIAGAGPQPAGRAGQRAGVWIVSPASEREGGGKNRLAT